MAKFYGDIGFISTVETTPDVYREVTTTRKYAGDILTNIRRWDSNSNTSNDSVTINNTFSIIADKFALENLGSMRYLEYLGATWKITSADIEYPRIKLSVGGVYNGN
jgi:hypothetical protein